MPPKGARGKRGRSRASSREPSREPSQTPVPDSPGAKTEHTTKKIKLEDDKKVFVKRQDPFFYLRSSGKESLERLYQDKLTGTKDLLTQSGLRDKLGELSKNEGDSFRGYVDDLLTFALEPFLNPESGAPKPSSLVQIAHSDFNTLGEIKPFDKGTLEGFKLRKGEVPGFNLAWLGGKDVLPAALPHSIVTKTRITLKKSTGSMTPVVPTPKTSLEHALVNNPALNPDGPISSPMGMKRRISGEDGGDQKRHKRG